LGDVKISKVVLNDILQDFLYNPIRENRDTCKRQRRSLPYAKNGSKRQEKVAAPNVSEVKSSDGNSIIWCISI